MYFEFVICLSVKFQTLGKVLFAECLLRHSAKISFAEYFLSAKCSWRTQQRAALPSARYGALGNRQTLGKDPVSGSEI